MKNNNNFTNNIIYRYSLVVSSFCILYVYINEFNIIWMYIVYIEYYRDRYDIRDAEYIGLSDENDEMISPYFLPTTMCHRHKYRFQLRSEIFTKKNKTSIDCKVPVMKRRNSTSQRMYMYRYFWVTNPTAR